MLPGVCHRGLRAQVDAHLYGFPTSRLLIDNAGARYSGMSKENLDPPFGNT
jgi:hypothetical protein